MNIHATGLLEDVIPFYECERLVEELTVIGVREYGGKKWLKQHHLISNLNIQAHINAAMRGDEYVMESLATFDKIKTLIYELLVAEAWRENVLPLINNHILENCSLKSYLVVFNESVIINLIETVCFHRTAVDAADDHLFDLIDYCYRYLTKLVGKSIQYRERDPKKIKEGETSRYFFIKIKEKKMLRSNAAK